MPIQEVRKFDQESFSSHAHKNSSDSIVVDSSINYLGDKNYPSSKESRNLPPKGVSTYYAKPEKKLNKHALSKKSEVYESEDFEQDENNRHHRSVGNSERSRKVEQLK